MKQAITVEKQDGRWVLLNSLTGLYAALSYSSEEKASRDAEIFNMELKSVGYDMDRWLAMNDE